MSKFAAITALLQTVGGISLAAGHHFEMLGVYDRTTNPLGRVFNCYVAPVSAPQFAQDPTASWAYLCLPLDDTEDHDEQAPRYEDTISVHGFCGDTSQDPWQSSEVELLCNLRDDIVKAVDARPKLGGAVTRLWLRGVRSRGGWPIKARRYGELTVTFGYEQWGA